MNRYRFLADQDLEDVWDRASVPLASAAQAGHQASAAQARDWFFSATFDRGDLGEGYVGAVVVCFTVARPWLESYQQTSEEVSETIGHLLPAYLDDEVTEATFIVDGVSVETIRRDLRQVGFREDVRFTATVNGRPPPVLEGASDWFFSLSSPGGSSAETLVIFEHRLQWEARREGRVLGRVRRSGPPIPGMGELLEGLPPYLLLTGTAPMTFRVGPDSTGTLPETEDVVSFLLQLGFRDRHPPFTHIGLPALPPPGVSRPGGNDGPTVSGDDIFGPGLDTGLDSGPDRSLYRAGRRSLRR